MLSKTVEDIDKEIYERTANLTKLNKNLQNENNKKQMAIEILEASEHRLIGIINNVVDGIVTIDEEGTIHSFNRAAEQLFGHKIEEVLGKNIDILIKGTGDDQSDERLENPFQPKKSDDQRLPCVITARKKDGTVFSAKLSVGETVIEGQQLFTGLIRKLEEKEQVDSELMRILNPATKS
jgi:PAS domain S-box-containing protein